MQNTWRQKGYTLIEMTVVITVLGLLAALVLPNLVAIQKSRELRKLKADLLRLPAEARLEAQRSQSVIVLRVDGDELVMERLPASDDPTGEPVEIRRLALSEEMGLDRGRLGEETVEPDAWEWKVYSDGPATAGQLEFHEGDISESLVLPAQGEPRWVVLEDGDTAETASDEETWPAGEVEQRGQS